jgi:hypothetical protein
MFDKKFGSYSGFQGIQARLNDSDDLNEFNLLLKPIAVCADFLNIKIMKELYVEQIKKVYEKIIELKGDDFKDKVQ